MIRTLPISLLGAGIGSYAVGAGRTRGIGYRITGVALIGAALVIAAIPATADQFRQATDNAEVRCSVSSHELTRVSLVGDSFANVSKITTGLPGQDFTVTSEPVRGDIYLSVSDGWTAPALSFFATSRKGFVYKFACSVDDVAAEQVFVSNPALAAPADAGAPASTPATRATALIAAMAADALPPGYKMNQPSDRTTQVGELSLHLVAEYRGDDLVGRHFRVDNRGRAAATLDPAALAPAAAIAVSVGDASLPPRAATNLFVVLPMEDAR